MALFKEYMKKVWASTDEFLASAKPEDLERTVTVKPLGDMTAIQALGRICLTHAMTHLGEIEMTRTLVGATSALAWPP